MIMKCQCLRISLKCLLIEFGIIYHFIRTNIFLLAWAFGGFYKEKEGKHSVDIN